MDLVGVIGTAVITSALVASVVAAVVDSLLGQWAAVRQARRDRYSSVVGTLVARIELPYRIRRRTDEEAATLQALRELFHANQEKLVADEAWVAADSEEVLRHWTRVRMKLDPWVTERAQEAWTCPPVKTGAAMNLDPPLPGPDVQNELKDLQKAIAKATSRLRR